MTTKFQGEDVPGRLASILLVKSTQRLIVRTALFRIPDHNIWRIGITLISTCESPTGKKGIFQVNYTSDWEPNRWFDVFDLDKFSDLPAEQDRAFMSQILSWEKHFEPWYSEEEVEEWIETEHGWIRMSGMVFQMMLQMHYSRLYGQLLHVAHDPENWAATTLYKRLGAYIQVSLENWRKRFGPTQY